MSNTEKAMNGGKWITIATVISTLFQFGQVAVLARLLAPTDFGLVSVSTLIITFFGIFTNLGFSNSIIYKQESDQRVLSTLYWLNLLAGFVIFGIIQVSAPAIVTFYHEPRLELVIRLASSYFLIVYFGQLYYFLLEKELRFRSVAIVDIVGTLIGSATTIMLAYTGLAELSLIIGSLVMQAVKTGLQILLGRQFFRPVFAFNLREVGEHLRFGLFNLGDGLLGFAQSNFDNIFIGGVLGVKELGYYTIAFQLAVFPAVKLNPIILQVAYPILARMKENASNLKSSYLKILDFLSYCNFPLLAGLFITADSVVPLLYGPGWTETVGLIQIFVFVAALSSLSHPLFTLAFTKGKPNLLFYLNLATLFVKIPLVFWLSRYGVVGIAVAFLLATLLNLIGNFLIVQSLIGDFLGAFLQNIAKPIVFCGIMVGVISGYKALFGPPELLGTIIEVVLGGAVYAGLTLAFKLSWAEVMAYRRSLG
jgi:lipopolysaccharide exporter